MSSWKTFVNSRSRSFALIVGAFCVGIALGPVFLFLRYDLVLAASILCASCGTLLNNRSGRIGLFILAALFFGISRYGQSIPIQGVEYAMATSSAIRVEGEVSAEVEHRNGGQRVVLDDVRIAGMPKEGRVLATFAAYPEISYGDSLAFNCQLSTPEPIERFRYDRYLASKDIRAICYRPQHLDVIETESVSIIGSILRFKSAVIDRLQQIIPEPHAAFLSGLLFGGSSSLSSELRNDFSQTGTSHILAASGFNVSLFTAVFLGWILGTRLGRRKSLWVTTILLFGFVIMAGATPAVIRAALMASVLLVGYVVRRKASMANVLLLVAALMLAVNPLILLDDVGFQLSFVATAALIFVAPNWEKYFSFLPSSFGIREACVGSLAAIIMTLPIVIWHFGSISLVAPIINLLILPMIPFVMAVMMVALVISLISVPAATIFALPAWALSSVILHLITWFAALPYASIATSHADLAAIVTLCALCLAFVAHRQRYYARAHLPS